MPRTGTAGEALRVGGPGPEPVLATDLTPEPTTERQGLGARVVGIEVSYGVIVGTSRPGAAANRRSPGGSRGGSERLPPQEVPSLPTTYAVGLPVTLIERCLQSESLEMGQLVRN